MTIFFWGRGGGGGGRGHGWVGGGVMVKTRMRRAGD